MRRRPLTGLAMMEVYTQTQDNRSNAGRAAEYRARLCGGDQTTPIARESYALWTIDPNPTEDHADTAVYSTSTRSKDGREGLLVDCAAVDNLRGPRGVAARTPWPCRPGWT